MEDWEYRPVDGLSPIVESVYLSIVICSIKQE